MGRHKTTGGSHNKNSSSYKSKRTGIKTDKRQQQTLKKFLQNSRRLDEEEEPCSSVNNNNNISTNNELSSPVNIELSPPVNIELSSPVNIELSSSVNSELSHPVNNDLFCDENSDEHVLDPKSPSTDDEDDENSNIIENANEDQAPNFKTIENNYMVAHQIQEKWESRYPFVMYTAKGKGWLCKVCTEYGEGSDHWITQAIKLNQHPTRTFDKHADSEKHKAAIRKKHEIKRMLVKGRVYKQMCDGERKQMMSTKERNRRVIKKMLKTSYFVVKKKWALRENFSDIIDFIKDIGDEDITKHLNDCSTRATYTSKTSAEEFVQCISDYLEDGFKDRLLAASEFSLLTDETTDISDRAELSIFIRYVNSDTHKVNEEFLGMVEVVGSKGAEALFNIICEVLENKGIDMNKMMFNGMDGTNTMSGERSGLQRRFRHRVPHTKYTNCRCHKLALVFVHLLPRFQVLRDVDCVILSCWKMMKYSSVKRAVFDDAQETFGEKKRKLLKAAVTRWLSHGEASKRLISRYPSLIDALDSILQNGSDQEVKGIRDELLQPDILLFLLLLSDILSHINRFSLFLQRKNLIFSEISCKFTRLKRSIDQLKTTDGLLFQKHSIQFLKISRERMELARKLRGNNLIDILDDSEFDERIKKFSRTLKIPFLEAVLEELVLAFKTTDPIYLAFDVFNVASSEFDLEQKIECINVLKDFYGEPQQSTFLNETNFSRPIIDKTQINDDMVASFFSDFEGEIDCQRESLNKKIRKMIENKELKPGNVDQYKEDHPLTAESVYASLMKERVLYPEILVLFKLSLLITPSTANVERGFSVLTLLATKQRNSLSPKTLDKLMRISLLGPEKLDDKTYDSLVDKFRDMKDRRIEL